MNLSKHKVQEFLPSTATRLGMDLGQLWESPEHGSAHHHHPCGWSSGKLSEQQRGMGVSIPQSHGLAGCTLVGPGFLLGNLALHALLLGGGSYALAVQYIRLCWALLVGHELWSTGGMKLQPRFIHG